MTQKQALQILKKGANVFLTGSAGSGKTYLLNQYIAYLKSRGIGVGVTASTGIAATHMNGKTIHSFAGFGIKDSLTPLDLQIIQNKHYLQHTFRKTDVLIIDEISMLEAAKLDMVNTICKVFRKNDLPFGGMQVVLCGDFFQLPPVSRSNTNEFVYTSAAWDEGEFTVCYLDEQHRQDDPNFLRLLNEIRTNTVSDMSKYQLQERINATVSSHMQPTKLFSHNDRVDAINTQKLATLPGMPITHLMTTKGRDTLIDFLKRNCLSPEKLVLKKNAVVMFTKNNQKESYFNGTLGVVTGFDAENFPIVSTHTGLKIRVTPETWSIEENNVVVAEVSQIPLRLAWAITIHKSQGMSLDLAEMDLSQCFVPGQGYVALSRVRTLAGISLLGINDLALEVNEEVLQMDQEFQKLSQEAEQLLKSKGKNKKK